MTPEEQERHQTLVEEVLTTYRRGELHSAADLTPEQMEAMARVFNEISGTMRGIAEACITAMQPMGTVIQQIAASMAKSLEDVPNKGKEQ